MWMRFVTIPLDLITALATLGTLEMEKGVLVIVLSYWNKSFKLNLKLNVLQSLSQASTRPLFLLPLLALILISSKPVEFSACDKK